MSYTSCIFDLDGTLIYTLESIARAGNRMLEALGFPPQPTEDYRFYCGDGARTLVERTLRRVGGLTEEHLRRGDELNRRFLAEQPLYGAHLYEGMRETLEELKRRGLRLAVVSNKPDDAAQLAIGGLCPGIFDHIEGQKAGGALKPDPAGALRAADVLGAKPADCLYFGDTWTDMETGRRAGMYTVGVLWGYRDREELLGHGAQALIERPEEILGLLR